MRSGAPSFAAGLCATLTPISIEFSRAGLFVEVKKKKKKNITTKKKKKKKKKKTLLRIVPRVQGVPVDNLPEMENIWPLNEFSKQHLRKHPNQLGPAGCLDGPFGRNAGHKAGGGKGCKLRKQGL